MAFKRAVLLLAIICFLAIPSSSAREAPRIITPKLESPDNGSTLDCWSALTEIKSCSSEIVAYFTNGTTDIGLDCCQAIRVITHNCWPAILTALGFTADETYILRGYCDASLSSANGPAQGPSVMSSLIIP